MSAFNEPQKISVWKSLQSQIEAVLAEHISKLSCVTALTSGVKAGQSHTAE